MGLDFSTLVQAALGGSAAYSQGKRSGRQDRDEREAKKQAAIRAEEVRQSQMQENAAQRQAALELAAERKDRMDHPEKYRAARSVPEHEAYATYHDKLVAEGMKPDEATARASARFGKAPPTARGPVPGSREDLDFRREVAEINASASARHRRPLQGRSSAGGGEEGSEESQRNRMSGIRKRAAALTKGTWDRDAGRYVGAMNATEAAQRAAQEWDAADSPFLDVTSGSATGKAMARGISANAGRSGVKPTESTSTPKANPLNANSPKAGTMKTANAADFEAALTAVGDDWGKVQKWLRDRNISPD